MGVFALHRACAYMVTPFVNQSLGVPSVLSEITCGEGDTREDARRNLHQLTNGRCSIPLKSESGFCAYWEEDTFLLRTLRSIADFAQWLGE